jgi:hypothetical protein
MVVKYGPVVEKWYVGLSLHVILPILGYVHLTGKEENELQVSRNKMPWKIFESEEDVNEECRIFWNFVISAAHLHLQ